MLFNSDVECLYDVSTGPCHATFIWRGALHEVSHWSQKSYSIVSKMIPVRGAQKLIIKRLTRLVVLSMIVGALASIVRAQTPQRDDSLKGHTICELNSGLKIVQIDRLAKGNTARTVQTSNGDRTISLADGYRVMVAYNNKRDWFVNIKAEKSFPAEYEQDKVGVIENLKYAASTTTDLEQPEPVKVSFNGYEGYGISKRSLTGNVVGMYVLFSDPDHTITTFYFINQNAKRERFKDIEEWRTIRDEFLNTYTTCINNARRSASPN